MKQILQVLVQGTPLNAEQATRAFELIMTGQSTPAQTGALLAMIQQRGPSAEEIAAAASVMRKHVVPVTVPAGLTVIDTCGTGGSGSRLFNISTAAAIVVAGAARQKNIAVAKHGNRAVTSKSGSSQVLEALGVKLAVTGETHTTALDEAGICFCFAPAHHPAMKYAGPVRAELGIRTLFNLVGPLTNPAGARRQLIGVSALDLLGLIADVLGRLDADAAMVVATQMPDGSILGELTNFAPAQVAHLTAGGVRRYQIDPSELGVPYAVPDSVMVDTPDDSAKIVRGVLDGRSGAARDIVALNAAAAMVVAGVADDMAGGLTMAYESIDQGKAKAALDTLVAITQADTTEA